MEIAKFLKGYIDKMKHFQKVLLNYIEDRTNEEVNFQDLIRYFEVQKVMENKFEIKCILRVIANISNNHQRNSGFFNKIERILESFKSVIIENFSNLEIFKIFKSNKRILLFIFNKNIITPDRSIYNIISNEKYLHRCYPQYFFKEFEKFFDEKIKQEFKSKYPEINDSELFEQKRMKGENDDYLCQLIQDDSLDEFISYVKIKNLKINYAKIPHSIYETNPLILKKNYISIIEYAAFFGSISIFKYLISNKVDLKDSIKTFSIHSQNAQLIHLLEENNIRLDKDCYIESIKCHHVDLSSYIENNLNQRALLMHYSQILPIYNYVALGNLKFSIDQNNQNDFFYFICKSDYINIVDYFLKNTNVNVNYKKI